MRSINYNIEPYIKNLVSDRIKTKLLTPSRSYKVMAAHNRIRD